MNQTMVVNGMKMTQFENLSSMEDSSTSASSSSNTIKTAYTTRPNSSEYRNSKIPSPKIAADHLRPVKHRLNKPAVINNRKGRTLPPSKLKQIRFYRNGDVHQEEQLVSLDFAAIHDWNDCLETINREVNYPGSIQLLFTLKGKKLSSITDLESETDIVVSGKSPFRLLAYGPSVASPNHSRTPLCRPNSGRRAVRAAFTKSVILEPIDAGGGAGDNLHPPLSKTVSEQNVSGSGGVKPSPLIREVCRKPAVNARGRPLSCYNPPTSECDGATPTEGSKSEGRCTKSSRIPKRILHPCNPSSPVILSGTTTPLMTQSTPVAVMQSPKVQRCTPQNNRGVRASSKDRTPKQDMIRKEFIRPRRVKIIVKGTKPRKASRFLLNKKTAVAFDQVLSAITESIKPEWGAVRKVFTLSGNEVATLEGFFGEEDTFLLCPNDRVSPEELILDPEECKILKVPYESEPSKRTKSGAKSQQRRPNSAHLSSSQASTRSTARSYPTHPRFISITEYPPQVKERFNIEDEIGDGNFAVVRLVVDKKSCDKFALKVIDKLQSNHDSPPDNEVVILSKLSHPNIILVFEKIDYRNELYVVMELIPSGDLFDLIARATKFSEKESAGMTRDIASALAYLHNRRIVHRDIKPENLLVSLEDGQRRIKLGDFGLAQQIKGPLFTVCGTPTYVSPEILAETGYGRPVDIWAAGVIVYILLCGYPPFVSPTGEQEDLFDLILTGDFEFPPEHWDSISNDAKHLILQMLEVDPDLRLEAESVLEHPWLSSESGKRRGRQCRKDDFQFSVFEQMGLTKLHFPSSIRVSNPDVSDDQDASL